ncbi:MAG TPA: hypothetical protein VJU77_12415 [Chthoniobacterales bacterium]|nr:hypothetical protein [Chthoniobacterales bacterium]
MKKLDTVRTYRTMDGGAGLEEQKTDFDYDGMGRPITTLFPDGTSEVSSYQHGQLETWKTRKDQLKTIVYDARGREISNSWSPAHTPTPGQSPIPLAPGINRAWDAANRLTSISNSFSTIGFGYDDASQVRSEQSSVTGANGPAQINYLRYPSGEVSYVQYPDQTWVRRNYTARGQLKDVGWGSSVSTSYVYLPDGKVDYQARLNGVTTSYGYDARGLISSVLHRDGTGHDLAKRDYWRDDRDWIKAWEKGINPGVNPRENGRGDRYQYDDAGQLTQAAYQAESAHDTAGTPERTDAFHYDEMGNRTGANWVASRGLMSFGGRNNKLNQYGRWENNIAWPDPLHWGLDL